MKEILIRPAFESDIPDILEITQEAFAKYAFDLGMPEKVKALKEDADAIRRDMAGKIVLIGQLDGVSVGSIRCQFLEGGMAYISRFGVKLAAQSCGIGGALIRAVVSYCKDKKVSAIALHTSAKMSSLIRFYYGNGFYIDSTAVDRGYVRALLIKELEPEEEAVQYAPRIPKSL